MSDKDKFIRWQLVRINQLTFLNNLILGLSIGLLGYIFYFINSDKITLSNPQKLLFWVGCITLIASIFLAIILAINRLEDFRKTANITRKKETKKIDGIHHDRNYSKIIGKNTWCLFYWQIATFLVSFLVFSIFILIEIFDKIT